MKSESSPETTDGPVGGCVSMEYGEKLDRTLRRID